MTIPLKNLAKPAKAPRLTTQDICAAMTKRWCDPQWAIMWEVGEGTGAASGRYADAVMMSLWPSRGLELHGVEIKVSRSDWRRESADPTKAEAIAKFCDRWWVHTAPGVVDDLSDVPPAWGLREFDGKVWRTIREAEKTDAAAITRPFLAALLRRADGVMQRLMREAMREAHEAQYAEAERMLAGIQEQIAKGVERRTQSLERAAGNVAAFDAAFGLGTAGSWGCDAQAWGNAARALADVRQGGGLGHLVDRLRKAADEIEALQAVASGSAAPADVRMA